MNDDSRDGIPRPTGPPVAGAGPSAGSMSDGRQIRTLDLLLVVAITGGLFLFVGALIDDPELTVAFVTMMLAIQAVIPMAAVYFVVIRGRGLAWADLGFRPPPSGWYLRSVLIALVALPLVGLINLATQAIIDAPFRNPQIDVLAPEGFTWTGAIAMLAMVGIVAPIVEEVVFRGLLYGWLRARFGVFLATGASALLFALAHGILILVPALLAIGIVLARVYERSGSLWPPIIVHGAFNAIMVIALYAALAAGVALE